ncbi:hypothetical protein E2562_035517 [Oryza meyeriana var. granulata]|uniref:Uncharacterized protein n=1 Tax=Oryza meyeriana var. granulata TaxID=110450 RepID=A0A6G1DAB4_9ORYZ|nr:hypothetical protein E2562_035517 [Oryza meyeriana var. granulata]
MITSQPKYNCDDADTLAKCKLVHGAAVDLAHPSALDFLKEDCLHVTDFFKKHGVAVMIVTALFNFVIDQNIAAEDVDDYLEKVQQKILGNGDTVANGDDVTSTVLVQLISDTCAYLCGSVGGEGSAASGRETLSPKPRPPGRMELQLVHCLADVEEAVKKMEETGAGHIYFLLASDASLAEAAAIQKRLGSGPGGYGFLNPDLVLRKSGAETNLNRHFRKLMEVWEGSLAEQISKTEDAMKKVKDDVHGAAPLGIPCDVFQQMRAFGGLASRTTIHTGNGPVPHVTYSPFSLLAPPILASAKDFSHPEEDILPMLEDLSLEAFRECNIRILQVKRDLLDAMREELRTRVHLLLEETLTTRSHIGSGLYGGYMFVGDEE